MQNLNSKNQSLVDEFLAEDYDINDQEEIKEPSINQLGQSNKAFDPEESNISAAIPTNQSTEGFLAEDEKPFHVGMLSNNLLAQ